MRNKNKTPNNKTLSIKKAVRKGNCKVFAKKILPPDKKINYKYQECGDFFCKTLYQPCQGAWGLIFAARFYYYHQYHTYLIFLRA
jgi:hypothetical protein